MSGGLEIKLDTRDFQRALTEYRDFRKKDNAYVCNRQGAQLAYHAFWNTDKAKAEKAAAFAIGSYVGIHGRKYVGVSRARAIVVGRLNKDGRALTAKLIKQRTSSLIAGKIRAGFIAAGWIPAVRKLKAKASAGVGTIRRKAGYGSATLARETINCFSEIINASFTKSKTSGAALERVGSIGLRKAVPIVTADMLKFIKDQLAKRATRFS